MEPILLVEDDADIRQDLAEILRDSGYDVVTAANGAEALMRLKSGVVPCVILLDLIMPIMSGWDFRCAQLSDPAIAAIPVILLSGAADVQHHASTLRASGCLTKPIKLDLLLDIVEHAC